MVSVCLTAKVDGTKLKTVVVFGAAKRKSYSLHEEFKLCVATSSGNAWMKEKLTTIWVKQVLGYFSLNRRFLALDSYKCHMIDSVRKDLKDMNGNSVIIPGWST